MRQTLEQAVRAHFSTTFGLGDAAGLHLWQTARQSLSQGLAALGRALEADNAAVAAHWAHSVKGDLLNMGLDDLAVLARSIEERAQGEALDACATPLASLREALLPSLEADSGGTEPGFRQSSRDSVRLAGRTGSTSQAQSGPSPVADAQERLSA